MTGLSPLVRELEARLAADEAKQILKDFRCAARHVGLTPEEFVDNCVQHLRDGRLLSEGRVGQEMQMMGVVWRILETETNDPEHPGKVADYIGNTNFDVDLEMHGGEQTRFVR
jgi:hypothetical protein